MTEPLHTREDRALAARISLYEDRPWVRPEIERWIETGEDSDGNLQTMEALAKIVAKHRSDAYLPVFYAGVEAAAKEVEELVRMCDIYIAAATPAPNAEHESLALPFHEARKQSTVRCLQRIRGLMGLSELSKRTS
jgi:hypothetical protein